RQGFGEVARRVRAALSGPAPIRPRVMAAAAAALVVVFGIALVVAPDKSQVELQMEAAAAAAEGEAPDDAADNAVGSSPNEDPSEDPSDESSETSDEMVLPSGDEISAFGDSMLYVAAPALKADFPGIDIDAKSNRQWPAVVDAIRDALDDGTVR